MKIICTVLSHNAPIARLVERWAPGSDCPGWGCFGARYMILLAGMVRDQWQGQRLVEVGERGGPRPAMCVSTLNL